MTMKKNSYIPIVVLNDTSKEGHIGCVGVMAAYRKVLDDHGMRLVRTYTRNRIESNAKAVKEDIINLGAKLVIINGEGTFHRSGSIWYAFLRALPKKVPAVIVNTVWEKMFVVPSDLDRFSLIAVRENLSKDAILKLKSGARVFTVPDMLFACETKPAEIGYGDSVMAVVARQLKKSDNFFPLNNFYNPDVVAYLMWLSRLRVYVTGRFHGVVLAALAGTPFLAIPSNSHKIEGLLKDMDCSELLLNSLDEVQDKIPLAVKSKGKVRKYCQKAGGQIDKLGAKLRSLCSK